MCGLRIEKMPMDFPKTDEKLFYFHESTDTCHSQSCTYSVVVPTLEFINADKTTNWEPGYNQNNRNCKNRNSNQKLIDSQNAQTLFIERLFYFPNLFLLCSC